MTDKIEEQGHKRGCEGRNYACTCGYDDRVDAELARLRSENDGMRKALEEISKVTRGDDINNPPEVRAEYYAGRFFTAQNTARAALSSLKEEGAR